jgi:hypothetical protein
VFNGGVSVKCVRKTSQLQILCNAIGCNEVSFYTKLMVYYENFNEMAKFALKTMQSFSIFQRNIFLSTTSVDVTSADPMLLFARRRNFQRSVFHAFIPRSVDQCEFAKAAEHLSASIIIFDTMPHHIGAIFFTMINGGSRTVTRSTGRVPVHLRMTQRTYLLCRTSTCA